MPDSPVLSNLSEQIPHPAITECPAESYSMLNSHMSHVAWIYYNFIRKRIYILGIFSFLKFLCSFVFVTTKGELPISDFDL